MSVVHWVLVPIVLGLTIAQTVLSLLSHSRQKHRCLLVHAIMCLIVALAQVLGLILARNRPFIMALTVSILCAGYVGVSIWVGVVMFAPSVHIVYPSHFTTIQSVLAIVTIILEASLVTLAWVGVAHHQQEVSDTESMKTAIQSEKAKGDVQDSQSVTPSISPLATMELAESIRKNRRALAALHNKESQCTLIAMPDSVDDDSTLNFIYKASLADTALYDSGSANWMNTMPISYLAPYLNKPRSLISSNTDSSGGSTWRHRSDSDENTLARSHSTGQLRVKKQRLMTRPSIERLQSVDEASQERISSPLKPSHIGSISSSSLTGFKNNINKAATATALAQRLHAEKANPKSVPEVESPCSPIFPEFETGESGDRGNSTPYRLSGIMDGLEDIPRPAPLWNEYQHTENTPPHSTTHRGIRNVSLEEWEANKLAWLSQSHSGKPILYAIASSGALSRSMSAPSLHTYRQISQKSTSTSEDLQMLDITSAHPITPVVTPSRFVQQEEEGTSPIKKMIGIFKRRDSTTDYTVPKSPNTAHNGNHRHTTSVANSLASFLASVASGKSTRSNSPRKSIKSLFTRSPIYDHAPPQRLVYPSGPQQIHRLVHHQSMSLNFKLLPGFLASQNWDAETLEHSESSRVSSIPSAVIGEYDKEKWRTLKELKRQAEDNMDGRSI